jgi:cation/acetate symporter
MAGIFETKAGMSTGDSNRAFKQQLNKVYKWYTGGFFVFVVVLAILEQMGLSREWIGFIFLLATIGLYAGIGIMSRTTDAAEYYVAGRRVPAVYNGMATGADWMSAASFIRHGRHALSHRLQRPGLHHGLDRWLLPGCAVSRALPA